MRANYSGEFVLGIRADGPLHVSRGDRNAYGFEMTDNDHAELAARLASIKGKAAVSGYRCDLLDSAYRGWKRIDAPLKKCHSVKKPRSEALWINYG